MDKPTHRRWFQFSIRNLLIGMALVAVFVAYHVNWIRQRREARIRWNEQIRMEIKIRRLASTGVVAYVQPSTA